MSQPRNLHVATCDLRPGSIKRDKNSIHLRVYLSSKRENLHRPITHMNSRGCQRKDEEHIHRQYHNEKTQGLHLHLCTHVEVFAYCFRTRPPLQPYIRSHNFADNVNRLRANERCAFTENNALRGLKLKVPGTQVDSLV